MNHEELEYNIIRAVKEIREKNGLSLAESCDIEKKERNLKTEILNSKLIRIFMERRPDINNLGIIITIIKNILNANNANDKRIAQLENNIKLLTNKVNELEAKTVSSTSEIAILKAKLRTHEVPSGPGICEYMLRNGYFDIDESESNIHLNKK